MNEDEPVRQPDAPSAEPSSGYVDAAVASLSAGARTLKDGTPVTGFSPAEFRLLTQFVRDAAIPGKEKRLRAYFEFPATANPYVVSFFGWLPYLQVLAAEAQRPVVFAAASTAAATLSFHSLHVLTRIEFVSWGDLAKLYERHELGPLLGGVIIGDLDLPDDNSVLTMMSSDGAVSQERVIRAVLALARLGVIHMVCFHREGWKSAFDLEEMSSALTSSPAAQGKCFVATACYGSHAHPTVIALRRFRDRALQTSASGRALIWLYEATSPPLARWLLRHPAATRLVRDYLLDPLATRLGPPGRS